MVHCRYAQHRASRTYCPVYAKHAKCSRECTNYVPQRAGGVHDWDDPASDTVPDADPDLTLAEWAEQQHAGGLSWAGVGGLVGCSGNNVRQAVAVRTERDKTPTVPG